MTDATPDALSPDNLHAHRCPRPECGTVWRHDPDTIPKGGHRTAHSCPNCGAEEYWKSGPTGVAARVPANFCHNGARTIRITEEPLPAPEPDELARAMRW